ncbi:regulatory protein GemA [Shewanella algae]|uniref:regulatory protein GemA n=1 Tax=Shewanella algae TaxID=38313 RepID=UPI001AAD71E5|nr:regulatory protein GemA [Shewanella algae]MBO2656182.1 regulatory protein GemA [Shewanella algae]
MTSRRSLLAKIHIARKQLLITEERYRELLKQCGAPLKDGSYSAADMPPKQLEAVIRQLQSMGGITNRGQKTRRNNRPQVSKLYAIWCELYRQDVVGQKSFLAMVSWCQRQMPDVPVDLNDASAYQLNQLIESMKQWLERMTSPIQA